MNNEQTNENEQTISLPNDVVVCLYSEFFIGALTQLKEMGKGPGEGGSGRVASGYRLHHVADMNQSELVTGHWAKSY
jgi:hypothetical protein